MCLSKLKCLLPEKDNCEEGDCRIVIDIKNVKIFDTENKCGRQLLERHGESKYCDCIIHYKGVLLIIEILCGKLTKKELNDKEKQVSVWQYILKKELTNCKIYCFIVFLKHSLQQELLKKKELSLRNKGILLKQFKRFKKPYIKLTELLQQNNTKRPI